MSIVYLNTAVAFIVLMSMIAAGVWINHRKLAIEAAKVGSDAEPDSQRRQMLLNAVVKVLGNTLPLRIPRRQYVARRTPSP